jgi:hypothetical protein
MTILCLPKISDNVMNAAWGTMQERDTVVVNLTETHKTVQNIKARGAFHSPSALPMQPYKFVN